jgi:hypothetical protein
VRRLVVERFEIRSVLRTMDWQRFRSLLSAAMAYAAPSAY